MNKLFFFCLGETAQKLAYILSNVALIEFSYHVIGVGSSFSSLDLTGVALAQIKKTLEEFKKMVGIILSTPLKTAVDKTLSAMNLLENEQISRAVKEFEGAKDDAQTAFHYAKGQGNELDHLRQVSTATRIILLAKLCIYSYDENSHTIEPFYVLDDKKQKAIAIELERDCKNFLEYHRTVQVGFFSLKKDSKQDELHIIKNELLKIAYPYISEGKKYTCLSRRLEECFEIKYDSDLIPDGRQNATVVKLGIRKKDNSKITESFYKSEYGDVKFASDPQNPAVVKLGIRKKDNSKITESFDKCDGDVEFASDKPITSIEEKKLQKTIDIRLFKHVRGSFLSLSRLDFIRTTDEMPIFYTRKLKNEVMGAEFGFNDCFLYYISDDGWYCSSVSNRHRDWQLKGNCVLRNRTSRNTKTTLELPPLSGWEMFTKEQKWCEHDYTLRADQLITLESLDCKEFISQPWKALDRSKFKDEIVVTASAENIRRSSYLALLTLIDRYLGIYEVDKNTKHKHSCVYKSSRYWYYSVYKTAGGQWRLVDTGNSIKGKLKYYNDSSPHSEWPPATGWRPVSVQCSRGVQEIELKIKINPV